jgi:hypothetical protein
MRRLIRAATVRERSKNNNKQLRPLPHGRGSVNKSVSDRDVLRGSASRLAPVLSTMIAHERETIFSTWSENTRESADRRFLGGDDACWSGIVGDYGWRRRWLAGLGVCGGFSSSASASVTWSDNSAG